MPPDPRPDLPERVLRQTRCNLALAVLLLVGYAALAIWAVYFFRHGAKDKGDQVLAAVKQRLMQEIGPLADEFNTAPGGVIPPAATALFEQVEEDLPTLTQTVEQQGKEVADHLEETIRKDLEARYRAARGKYRDILHEEFPEITDEAALDRMTGQFEEAFGKLIRRYHLKEYRERVDQTSKLWKAIPPAPLPPGGTKALGKQLENEVRQWVRLKLVSEVLGSFGKEGGQ
jgi:hypothetical protein